MNDNFCVEHWCRNLGGRLRNHKFPLIDVKEQKMVKSVMTTVITKNASIRGQGGHRLTGAKCTAIQTQVKSVVKSVTSEEIPVSEKVILSYKTM